MLPYLAMIAVPGAFALAGGNRRIVRVGVLLSCIIIGWFLCVRLNVGMDWNNYLAIFRHAEGRGFWEIAEIRADVGWSLLLYLAHATGLGLTGINITAGVVFAYGLHALLRECEEPLLGLLAAMPILIIAIAMSAVRQTFSIGLELLLIANWFRWGLVRQVVVLLLAASFHFSAVGLLALLICDRNLAPARRNLLAIAGGVLFLAALAASARLDSYTETYVASTEIQSSGVFYHLAFLIVPYAFYIWRRSQFQELFGRMEFLDAMAIGTALCVLAAPFASTAADRLSLYFWPGAIIIYAGMPAMMQVEASKMMVRLSIIGIGVATTIGWLTLSSSGIAYLPYQSIFIAQEDRVRGSGPLE